LNGQTFVDIKNSQITDNNNNFSSIELNSTNKNTTPTTQFGNEISINSLKNMPMITTNNTSNNKMKFSNGHDKNNNNEEENYENQYQTLRKDDQIDQNVKTKISLSFLKRIYTILLKYISIKRFSR
jgi:hypothetical protein